MNADDTPTTTDAAAERFAAAVDGAAGTVDPELARELAVVNRLTAHATALDPDPEARARARRRLLAALAEEAPRADGPSRAS